ncbi:hypothetical protein [Rothia sp. P5766]|uniref:hypothetical protein n=1 Tax=Rothia sp. P5766 TaxID=3402656 RepID=UPI003AEB9B12
MQKKSQLDQLGKLKPQDVAHRVSAYTYGNILALGALILTKPGQIAQGHTLTVLLATGLTTYLAHFLAESQEHRLLHGKALTGQDIIKALRNAVPIMSSTLLPALFIALGSWGFLAPPTAWFLAVTVLLLRLASMGFVVARYQQQAASFRTLLGGILFASLGLVVALLKALLTH